MMRRSIGNAPEHMFPLPVPLLAGAIDRERRIVSNSIITTKRRVEALSKSLGVDPVRAESGVGM